MPTCMCSLVILHQYVPLQPGRLKHVQAIGWYLEEANMAQVSVNITDHTVTQIHKVHEEVCKDAEVKYVFIISVQQIAEGIK